MFPPSWTSPVIISRFRADRAAGGDRHPGDAGCPPAARDRLLEQMRSGRGDDDYSAVARKYLPETGSTGYQEPQMGEQDEQAKASAIAVAVESFAGAQSTGLGQAEFRPTTAPGNETKEATSLRRGLLMQLLRRWRQLLKRPVSSKEV